MNRRNLFASTALVSVALAGCASPSTNAQAVFAQIQYLLPLAKVLAIGISIAVPGAAGVVASVTPYLDTAASAFQSLSTTMTAVDALPIVQKVEGYARNAVDILANTVNGAPPGSTLAKFAPEVEEAQAVLSLITAFATGVQAMPTAAMVGTVSLPLLHR